MSKFSHRSYEKELMDDLECSGEVLNETLRELKTVNRWLGGNFVTTSALYEFQKKFPQDHYTIADIGCGGGDMIRVMNSWAEGQSKAYDFVGIDANSSTIEFAQGRNPGKNIKYLSQNIFDDDFSDEQVDIAACTLFTHHFTDEELIQFFTALKSKCRLGFLVNDLHRHPLAYYSIKAVVNIFSRSPMVKNDAPLSVLRSFSKEDWKRILSKAGISKYQLSWHWAFRWRLIVLF